MRAVKDENVNHSIEWGWAVIGWGLMLLVIVANLFVAN